ncbi:ABC transporter ATP-binding protein/permease [Thioclava sp. GXIMD4216]|uniref:ABCB family ABC transporter ATP-binding protein/permease n=1 Tax=Thioclava sp. GXIMD4216 TaxID=3131929 RepID=UPI0030D2F7D2
MPPDTSLPSDVAKADRKRGWTLIRFILPYLWPAEAAWVRRRVVWAMLLLVTAKVITLLTPYLYKLAVDTLSGDARDPALLLPLGAVALTVAYGVARFLSSGVSELRNAIFAPVQMRATKDIALKTFRHMHMLSLRYHIGRKTGAITRIIERGVKASEVFLSFLLFNILPMVIEMLFVLVIFAVAFDWRYALVLLVTIMAYVVFTLKVTEWRVRVRQRMNKADQEANQKAIDSLLNYETVKYFNADAWEMSRYDASMADYAKAAIRTDRSLAFLNAGQALIISSGLCAVMVMAAMETMRGALSVGDFVMVQAYMIQITTPLNFLGSVYRNIRQGLTDMGEMHDLLEQRPEVQDKPDATPLQVTGGHVTFRDVRFHYMPERPILKGISLDVAPGQTVALVGPSGSGKSTIGRLMFRFYDVTGGGVEIDGQDLRDVTQSSLHAAIGVVPQDTVLFNDSVGYNIAYARPQATRDEVIAAAKAARIHDFIESLPEGYDTQVGERGLKLSGGEKQRVGIARTILKNPPILLLDEATSALDTQTERDIQASLAEAGQGRTVITIAHRLSTIVDADQIVVMEAGQIVERGRHEALLAKGGRYARMWARQSAEIEREDGAQS